MEAVLNVYQTDYNPDIPVICIDEAMKQLVKEVQVPIAAAVGQPERVDYQYERNGTANLFIVCEPMVGWRRVEVTERGLIRILCKFWRWERKIKGFSRAKRNFLNTLRPMDGFARF